jgi:hypothetical protein
MKNYLFIALLVAGAWHTAHAQCNDLIPAASMKAVTNSTQGIAATWQYICDPGGDYANHRKYVIGYKVKGDPAWKEVGPINLNNYTLQGGAIPTTHWRVRVQCPDGTLGPWSATKTVKFAYAGNCTKTPVQTAIAVPSTIYFSAYTVHWQFAPNVEKWQVEKTANGQTTLEEVQGAAAQFNDTVKGQSYSYRIRPVCNGVTGQWSASRTFVAGEGCN